VIKRFKRDYKALRKQDKGHSGYGYIDKKNKDNGYKRPVGLYRQQFSDFINQASQSNSFFD
jgi:hypothetical protein